MSARTTDDLIRARGIFLSEPGKFNPNNWRAETDWAFGIAEAEGWSLPKGVPSEDELRGRRNGGSAPPEDPERRHVRAYSLPELAALQPEQVEWVLGDYIAAGDVASLESAPKCGKTTLLRKLHVHVATGAPFLGHVVKQGPSLYCTEERAGTSREGFARAGGLHLPDVHVMFLHDFHGMEWAERAYSTHLGHRFRCKPITDSRQAISIGAKRRWLCSFLTE